MLYILSTLVVFLLITEQEPNPGQRQLFIYICACLVWPLLALGLLFEKRKELLYTLKYAFEVPEAEEQLPAVLFPLDEVDPETL